MKDIKNYEGLYAATEDGRIWSYRRKKFLAPATKKANGYQEVSLSVNGKNKVYLVHRLIAETYLDNPDNLPQVNHKDENKTNNSVSNLEWCTAKYNTLYGTGSLRSHQKQYKRVYCVELDQTFESAKEASKATKTNYTHLCQCCRGEHKSSGGYHWRYV
jgi:hypothetical protein